MADAQPPPAPMQGRRATDVAVGADVRERVPNPDLLLSRVLLNEAEIKAQREFNAETRHADREHASQVAAGIAADLVKTTASDRALIEQRSESLADELERRASHILNLGKEERSADQREYGALINALEERRIAATGTLEQKVQDWRASDREARTLQAGEYARRLTELSNEHGRTQHVLNNVVTREVWQSEKDALHAQFVALDRSMLGMTPLAVTDRAHADMQARNEQALSAASQVLDTKIEVAQKQIAELKEYVDKTTGRAAGSAQLYGWIIGAVGLLISAIFLANALLGK